jgi:hypothetical protein
VFGFRLDLPGWHFKRERRSIFIRPLTNEEAVKLHTTLWRLERCLKRRRAFFMAAARVPVSGYNQ